MWSREIITFIVAIMIFARVADAQDVSLVYKDLNGMWAAPSSDKATSLFAGQIIRLKVLGAGDQESQISLGGPTQMYEVPCDSGSLMFAASEASTAQINTTGQIGDPIYNWYTERSWRGTCRLITVRLKDGSQHTAWFRFK